MKKTILFLVAVWCLIMNAPAQNNVITYEAPAKLEETNEDWAAGLRPDSFDVAITSHTFAEGKGTITFTGELTDIKARAFYDCKEMTSITLPGSVRHIGEKAFYLCVNLLPLTVPNTVTAIGEDAFYRVSDVKYEGSATGSPWGARSINGYIEGPLVYSDNSKKTLLACRGNATGDIVISNTVDSIGNGAFCYCKEIRSVKIPNSIKKISPCMFQECQITSITLSQNIKKIGYLAFLDCRNLKHIISEGSTPPVCGLNAFFNVPDSVPVYVPSGSISAYRAADEWSRFSNIRAYEKYGAYVNYEHITNANSEDILEDGGSMRYDDDAKTLTLNNVNLEGGGDILLLFDTITIECVGDNVIKSTGESGYHALQQDAPKTTIGGSGSVTFSGTGTAVYVENSLIIKDQCTVTVESSDGFAVCLAGDDMTVRDGARLIAKGNGRDATINGCYNLILGPGIQIRTNHTYDAESHKFLNAAGEEATDDIVIGPEESGIEETEKEACVTRQIFHDGRILILRNGETYDLLGHRIK